MSDCVIIVDNRYIIHRHYPFKPYYPHFYQQAKPQQTQVKSLGEGDLPRGVEGTDEGVDGGVMLSLSLYRNFSFLLCSPEW
jgi:hypothetical protein